MTALDPHFTGRGVTLYHGDCIEVMRALPDASVDSVVTDPPYGLEFMGKDWDRFDTYTGGNPNMKPQAATVGDSSGVTYGYRQKNPRCRRCGKLMRGNGACKCPEPQIDTRTAESANQFQAWCEDWATEAWRVLKPGGHLLAFGGSRTWHRLACAVEDAGFEIRDSIAWLYGSGFPKSLDVSKAIDKRRDDTEDVRVVCRWLRARIDEHPTESVRTIAARFGFHPRMVEHWAARDTDSQPTLPTLDQWDALRKALDFTDEMDAEVLRLNLRKGEPGEAWADRPVTGQVEEWDNRVNYAMTSRDGLRRDIPATPDAERWQGWGTALKPAFEPIVVARKPLAGTVAANVLQHGTGALNIDGCRVGTSGGGNACPGGELCKCITDGVSYSPTKHPVRREGEFGRWPTNVVLDDSQAAELDRQSGTLTSGVLAAHHKRAPKAEGILGAFDAVEGERGYGDSGGASRFFPVFRYEAKAPTGERPRAGEVAHPTVKPLDLMRWLVRLVTPPGGTVLEPFAGSGTTAEACVIEGFECIAIEREADYLPLITQRLNRRTAPVEFLRATGADMGLFEELEGGAL
jgi:DNA modification methylase